MSGPGRAESVENPASAGQRPTESSSSGGDHEDGGNGQARSEQPRRRHPPEVYAALQQLLFEGQLRLVLADDSPIPDDHDPATGLPNWLLDGIHSVNMLRRIKDTGPESGSDDDSDYFDPNDESWLDDLDPSERGYCRRCGKAFYLMPGHLGFCTGCGHFFEDHRDFYVLDGEDEKKKPVVAKEAAAEEPAQPEPGPPAVDDLAESMEAMTMQKQGMRRIENAIIYAIKEGTTGIAYDDIFQECCNDSVRGVVMYDSYAIHGDYQMENFRKFCNMLKRRCSNLEKIELHTKRPDEAVQNPNAAANRTSPIDKRRNFLDDLQRRCAITLDVKEYDHKAPIHSRYTRFLDEQNDGWQVLSDIGLDIFNRPAFGRGSERKGERVATCKNTHFAMFRPGTDVLFPLESLAPSLTTMPAPKHLSPNGRSSGYFAKKAQESEQKPNTTANLTN